ncbi:YcnI family protein [Streptomyces sp. NPDC127178]|uniref:YcnI family copper-binding membrane protein n=1 Tax=unclassified Streptomyces TaxID=2593676 RepID=UPI0036357E3B
MNVYRAAAAAVVAATSVVVFSGAAFAHVSVQPQGEAAKGGYATINFEVPSERDNASTVKLEVHLPTEHPLASVMPQPVPGWKVEVTKAKLDEPLEVNGVLVGEAASKVTWTADGSKIGPGQFQQFALSIGRLPEDTDQMVFKTVQTYDNKERVAWFEEPKGGGEEPESPAPVLKLSAAAEEHHGGGTHGESAASSIDNSDSTARVLGVVGIVVGAAGIAFGVLAGRRRSS